MIVDINEQAGVAKAAQHGKSAHFVKTDVTSDAEMQRAIDAAGTVFGAVHGLVCAAGIAVAERVLPKEGVQPLAHFTRTITINLIGTFNAIRLAAAAMAGNQPNEDGERGVIVSTASVAAYDGQIGQAAYSASKGGIVGMTLPLAREFARIGVRVHGDRPRDLRYAAPRRAAPGRARVARAAGAVSVAAGTSRGIRRPRPPHLREPDAERRSHTPRRGDTNGAKMNHPC